jgi:hypothetical protein
MYVKNVLVDIIVPAAAKPVVVQELTVQKVVHQKLYVQQVTTAQPLQVRQHHALQEKSKDQQENHYLQIVRMLQQALTVFSALPQLQGSVSQAIIVMQDQLAHTTLLVLLGSMYMIMEQHHLQAA